MYHGISHMEGYPLGNVRWGMANHQTWEPLLVTSGGDHWRPVQTCSFGDPPVSDI